MKLKFKKLHSLAIIPEYKTKGSAGFDFHVLYPVIICPGELDLLPSGLAIEVPQGFELQVRQRSGLSIKFRNYLANAPGTVDSDYRGEIKFPIVNNTKELMTFKRGERILQGIIAPINQFEIEEVDTLSDTDRGEGGFGSTGK